MPKYNQETRERAMALMAEKSAKAVSDEMHINVMTLYKWRREDNGTAPKAKAALEGMDALLAEDVAAKDRRIAALEAENARLNETIKGLEERVSRFRAIIEALIR
jgi:transposase-like protein